MHKSSGYQWLATFNVQHPRNVRTCRRGNFYLKFNFNSNFNTNSSSGEDSIEGLIEG